MTNVASRTTKNTWRKWIRPSPLGVFEKIIFSSRLLRPIKEWILLSYLLGFSPFSRIFVSPLRYFCTPRFRRLALLLCFWASLAFLCISFSESWAPYKIRIIVSDSSGSFLISMSKFSLAMMARWNWLIQLVKWIRGSTEWFGQKAGFPVDWLCHNKKCWNTTSALKLVKLSYKNKSNCVELKLTVV